MNSEPRTPRDLDEGRTRPEQSDEASADSAPDSAPDASPDEVEPAFDIDLEPEEQGLAEAGDEPTG